MRNFVVDRAGWLKAIVSRAEEVEYVKWYEGLQSAFRWYGIHRRVLGRRLAVTAIDEHLDWIDVGTFGIAWPKGRPASRLVGALVELWAPTNSHYYFSHPTPMRPGSVVVDVGATEGSFAVECLVRYHAGDVWCFEPDSSMTPALTITAERNRLIDKMHVVQAAVTKSTGMLQIVENAEDPLASYIIGVGADHRVAGNPTNVKEVQGICLDDWAVREEIAKLDFLKIDAEGSDLAVLEGARGCLKRWRPAIAVTTYHHPAHCNDMIKYLASLNVGYHFNVRGVISFDSIVRPVMLHAAC